MTDQEWLAYRDKLAVIEQPTGAEIAECLGALLERLNTVIVSYVNRGNDDTQALIKRIDAFRVAVADVRTILEDHDRRLGHERTAGNG